MMNFIELAIFGEVRGADLLRLFRLMHARCDGCVASVTHVRIHQKLLIMNAKNPNRYYVGNTSVLRRWMRSQVCGFTQRAH